MPSNGPPPDKHSEAELRVRDAGPLAWLKCWYAEHRTRFTTIQDSPHSIALGSAIGIFFGFTPLLGLKTLLSIGVAWLLRSNKIAAAIAVTVHDVILPFTPAIYYWEYKIGFRALHGHWPGRGSLRGLPLREYMNWTTFFTVGQPLSVGSLFLGLPCAVLVYFVVRPFIERSRVARARTRTTEKVG